MFYKSTLLSIIFLFFLGFTNAQNVPGYLGKKGMVEYHFNSPILIYLLADSKTNFMHEIRFSYITGRKTQLGFGFELFKLKGDNTETETFGNEVRGRSFNFNADFYIKNSLAPVGSYFRLELKYLFGEYENNVNTPFPVTGEFNNFYGGIGYGIRRIFFDKLVFNVGGSIGRNLNFKNLFDNPRDHELLLNQAFVIRLNLGVGVLLF